MYVNYYNYIHIYIYILCANKCDPAACLHQRYLLSGAAPASACHLRLHFVGLASPHVTSSASKKGRGPQSTGPQSLWLVKLANVVFGHGSECDAPSFVKPKASFNATF